MEKKEETEEIKRLALEMAKEVNRNIRDITNAITMNIDYEKKHTILSAYAAVYAVSEYFEFKLTEMGLPPAAVQKAKDNADKYVLEIISGDLGSFSTEKGEA
jgi:hypothetical protein